MEPYTNTTCTPKGIKSYHERNKKKNKTPMRTYDLFEVSSWKKKETTLNDCKRIEWREKDEKGKKKLLWKAIKGRYKSDKIKWEIRATSIITLVCVIYTLMCHCFLAIRFFKRNGILGRHETNRPGPFSRIKCWKNVNIQFSRAHVFSLSLSPVQHSNVF